MAPALILLFFVFFGSGIGGCVRFFLAETVQERYVGRFPIGTLVVNVTGAFLIGLLAPLPWASLWAATEEPIRAFLITGFLGGFTTVSAFSLQTFYLIQNRPACA